MNGMESFLGCFRMFDTKLLSYTVYTLYFKLIYFVA